MEEGSYETYKASPTSTVVLTSILSNRGYQIIE